MPFALPVPRKLVLARSAALDTLVNELRKYLRQQVDGRSCLIAGPRGSGKTTLVITAHDELQDAVSGTKLIRVRLHGPSLLTVPEPKKDEVADSLYEHVLKTLVINLYQTAAEEVSNAYRSYMQDKGGEALEFAAQLRISLDGAPSAATLRYFWEKAGALQRGVLFPHLQPTDAGFRADQGVAEIVALATAAEAYRKCTGRLEQKLEDQSSAGKKQELKAEIAAKGKDLSQALISIASGLAVGAAAWPSSAQSSHLGAALGGAVTAVASMAALNYTSSLSRETTIKEQITFLPDTKASSLVHRVPLLLRRLRQAGLAPFFFVDELDKIKHLSEVMRDLAGHLKFICADQAFFCFLTDRAYLVETARINRERTNAVQRTIFTDLLYIVYETGAVDYFLRRVIRAVGGHNHSEAEADAEAARFILIHRSRMLLFELISEITSLRGPDDVLHFGPKGPRGTLVHQFHLMLQLAVEVVLHSPSVVERLTRDPDFGQTIYDALYYPTQRWYVGARKIDCSPNALVEGMAELYGGEADNGNSLEASTALQLYSRQGSYSSYVNLPASDKMFLHASVKSMLGLVAEPFRLKRAISDANTSGRMSVSQLVLEAVPERPRLLAEVTGSADGYEWFYNRYGIAHEAADVAGILSSPGLQDGELMIRTLTSGLAGLPRTASVTQIRTTVVQAEELVKFFAGFKEPLLDGGTPAVAKEPE